MTGRCAGRERARRPGRRPRTGGLRVPGQVRGLPRRGVTNLAGRATSALPQCHPPARWHCALADRTWLRACVGPDLPGCRRFAGLGHQADAQDSRQGPCSSPAGCIAWMKQVELCVAVNIIAAAQQPQAITTAIGIFIFADPDSGGSDRRACAETTKTTRGSRSNCTPAPK